MEERVAIPIAKAMMIFFIQILLIKDIHKVHSSLGCVIHPEFNEIAVMDQPQHGRDFGLIREPSHAPDL